MSSALAPFALSISRSTILLCSKSGERGCAAAGAGAAAHTSCASSIKEESESPSASDRWNYASSMLFAIEPMTALRVRLLAIDCKNGNSNGKLERLISDQRRVSIIFAPNSQFQRPCDVTSSN